MEKSMCKIFFEKRENNDLKKGIGSVFFCQLNNNIKKYALFTNNHILNKSNIEIGNIINFEYCNEDKKIEKYIQMKN